MNSVKQAKNLAKLAHSDQKYGSHPYIYHLEGVAKIALNHPWAKDLGFDNVEIVSYLHDIVEDTGVTIETVYNLFGDEIGKAVALLTKTEGYNHEQYIKDIKLVRLALVVKTSDALFNLQESVLQGNKKRIDRYMKLIKELSE